MVITYRGWATRAPELVRYTIIQKDKINVKAKPRGEGGALGSELNVACQYNVSYRSWFPLLLQQQPSQTMTDTDT